MKLRECLVIPTILILLITFCSCKNNNIPSKPDSSTTHTRLTATDSSSILYRYLHITRDEQFTTDGGKIIGPYDKDIFKEDSSNYYDNYIKNLKLKESDSFPVLLKDLRAMFARLSILNPFDSTSKRFNGIRIFPAIVFSPSSSERTLYLVFMGEQAQAFPGENYAHFYLMGNTSHPYYGLSINGFVELKGVHRNQVSGDTINFKNFWINQTYRPRKTIDSYCFSIAEFYEMLDSLGLKKEFDNPKSNFGLLLYPCKKKENDKLIFVAKAMEIKKGKYSAFEYKDFYDHMDECPSYCPTDQIK